MLNNLLARVFGSRNQRVLKRLNRLVEQVNAQESRYAGMSDAELAELAIVATFRSDIPAVTHVDYSARIQTVHRDPAQRHQDPGPQAGPAPFRAQQSHQAETHQEDGDERGLQRS